MNEKLRELYYRDDVIIGSKNNFIKLAKQNLNASTKDINEFLKNQEINQINKKPTKHDNLKITAPPKSFQIDIMYYPIGDTLKRVLLLVDIQSRKAWAYVLSNSLGDTILNTYKEFLKEVGKINSIQGDNQFGFKAFQEFNEQHNIRLDSSISKDEHISKDGNKLGIIDRLVRTLKEMIEKYRTVISKQGSFSNVIDKVISVYNSQVHRILKMSPNDMYKDIDKQILNNELNKNFNENILKNNKIETGATARILESKGKLEKGSQKYSLDTYKLVGREGNRFTVEDSQGEKIRRKLKPSEIQVIKTTENNIDRTRIAEHAAEKKSRQTLNKLIVGSKMTKEEAKKAVETLKTNDTAPARSTRGKKIDFKALASGKN